MADGSLRLSRERGMLRGSSSSTARGALSGSDQDPTDNAATAKEVAPRRMVHIRERGGVGGVGTGGGMRGWRARYGIGRLRRDLRAVDAGAGVARHTVWGPW